MFSEAGAKTEPALHMSFPPPSTPMVDQPNPVCHIHTTKRRGSFFFFLIFILFLVTFISFSFLSFFLFIWLHQVLVAACKIFIASRGLLCSSCGARALECTGSVAVARRLSCLTARGILVPRPGIEPVSPALEGGFLTTGPPGKSGKEAL